MIKTKDVFIFFSNKDNFNDFKEYNPDVSLTYKQMFKDYNMKKINSYTHEDFINWLKSIEDFVNLSAMVDYYEKFV